MSKASQVNLFSELRTVAQLASRTVLRRTGLLGGLSLSSLVAACGGGGGEGGGGGGGGGGTASTSSKTLGYVISGADAGDEAGWSVSFAGDVNKDGVADLLIGAPAADPNSRSSAGETYLLLGGQLANLDAANGSAADGRINPSNLNGTTSYILNGINLSDQSGWSVSSAGDVNKDGHDDLLIGAPFADPNSKGSAGEAYLIFGGQLASLDAEDGKTDGSIDLSKLNGTTGYIINGVAGDGRSGHSVSSAGDVSGDGADDLLIGAYYADPNGKTNSGETYLVLGGTSNLQSFDAQDGSTDGVLNLIA